MSVNDDVHKYMLSLHINILKCLVTLGNAFKSVYKIVEFDLAELNGDFVAKAEYGIRTALLVVAYRKRKLIGVVDDHRFNYLSNDILYLFLCAHNGDQNAQNQLKVIEKVVRPEKYDITATEIEKLANRNRANPSRARAYEVRHLMGKIAFFVEPAHSDEKDVTKGPVKARPDDKIHEFLRGVDTHKAVARNLKAGSTLQSLAISIYLEQLEGGGIDSLNAESIKRDMGILKDWEKSHPELVASEYVIHVEGGGDLPYQHYPEEWKLRKRGSGGGRAMGKNEAQHENTIKLKGEGQNL